MEKLVEEGSALKESWRMWTSLEPTSSFCKAGLSLSSPPFSHAQTPERCCRCLDGLEVGAWTILSAAPTCSLHGIRQGLKGHFNRWCPRNVDRYSSKEIKLERSRMGRKTHLRSLVKYKANIGSCWPAKWTCLKTKLMNNVVFRAPLFECLPKCSSEEGVRSALVS